MESNVAQIQREALREIANIDIGDLQEPIDGDSSSLYQNAKYDGKKFLGKEIPAWYAVGWYRSLKEAIATAKAALAEPPRNCDRLDWRKAWDLWITEKHPQKPQTFNEAYKGTVSFMDWYMSKSEKEGEVK